MFYCPSQKNKYFIYENFIENPRRNWGEFPSSTTKFNGTVRSSYNYFPQKKGQPKGWWKAAIDEGKVIANKISQLSPYKTVLTDLIETQAYNEPIYQAH
ncbi:MAG: hypothetical protein GY799_24795, partial [Desulfobulbaceae bacterium]|nr:hypothetical protein [Desulfobulbaceae bacterium]